MKFEICFCKSSKFGWKFEIYEVYRNLKFNIYKIVPHCNSLYTSFVLSRLTIVSREAKKKQAVRDEQVSYLHVAPL